MAKKKQIDNLSLDMIHCKEDGFGCHYGNWKMLHPNTKVVEEETLPNGWLICRECGKPFKPRTRRSELYCEAECQKRAAQRKFKEKNKDYYRNKMAEYRERKLNNESYA